MKGFFISGVHCTLVIIKINVAEEIYHFCTPDITQSVKIEQFLAEMELMKMVSRGDNPHVIKMVGCVSRTLPLSIIMEYAPGGSLLQCLRDVRLCSEVSVLHQIRSAEYQTEYFIS